MRRKRKKIIKVRRNPTLHASDIGKTLYNAHLIRLVDLIIIYNQGHDCLDCGEPYISCKCEHCEDCGHDRCLCILNDIELNDKSLTGRNEIRKIVWEFTRHTNINLKSVIRSLNYYYNIKYNKNKEYELLNSLTPNSKFPKYTSIMKRLFEID